MVSNFGYHRPETFDFLARSTRGHSVLRKRSYGGGSPVRRGDHDVEYAPQYIPPMHKYDARAEESAISSAIDREFVYSNQLVDDSYDVANQSRHRDKDLLEHTNRAIVATETHATPKTAVASRRAHRGTSLQPVIVPKTHRRRHDEVVVVRSASPTVTQTSHTGSPVVLWSEKGTPVEVIKGADTKHSVVIRSPERASSVKRTQPKQAAVRVSVRAASEPRQEETPTYKRPYRFKSLYGRRKAAKAALVGTKVDVVLPEKRSRPKSKYAADKMRSHEPAEEGQGYQVDAYRTTTGLTAHAPRYRLESRMKPEDLLYDGTKAFGSMRDRVRDVHDKMDRHRQLMDRYMTPNLGPEEVDVAGAVMNKYVELESRNPIYYRGSSLGTRSSSAGGGGGHGRSSVWVPPNHMPQYTLPTDDKPAAGMSDTRRRLRRVICKNRRDPSYFT